MGASATGGRVHRSRGPDGLREVGPQAGKVGQWHWAAHVMAAHEHGIDVELCLVLIEHLGSGWS